MPSPVSAYDLIKGAMRLCGAIATGEVPTSDEATDGLTNLNDLLENWSTQPLLAYSGPVESFNTVVGQASYTIGTGGNWNTNRPVRLNDDSYCTVGGVDFPIKSIGQGDYNEISLKTQQQPIIERLLYVQDFPLGIITLWPVPSQIVPVVLDMDRILTQVANTATTLNLPPGYAMAIRYNLCIMMAPDYGRSVSSEVASIAAASIANIKRANKVIRRSSFDPALLNDEPAIYQTGQ